MSIHGRCWVVATFALGTLAGCSPTDNAENPAATPATLSSRMPGRVAGDTGAVRSDDGQWRMPARNYASTRYSGLDQITTRNVGQLRLAWSFSTGVNRGHEAAPLVVDSTMYVVTPFPNLLYALDLTRPGAPLKWTYNPRPALAAQIAPATGGITTGAAAMSELVFPISSPATWPPSVYPGLTAREVDDG